MGGDITRRTAIATAIGGVVATGADTVVSAATSGQTRTFAGEIAKDVDRAAHFAFGLGQGFTFLARHVAGHGFEVLVEDVGGLEQDGAARAGIG